MLARWLSWLLGGASLAGVILAAVHFSEGKAFLQWTERAEPRWLLVAVFLPAGTYAAQGGIWRRVGAAAGTPLSRKTAFEFSLAKLFADQPLPSAGLSSSVLIAKALEQRTVPPGAVSAAVVVNIATYHMAYVIALAGALVILAWRGEASSAAVLLSVLLLLLSIGLSAAVLALAGDRRERLTMKLRRFRTLRTTIEFVGAADVRLAHNRHLLASAATLRMSIMLFDAATVRVLIRALGFTASVGGVFARSVLTLRMTGVDVPVALSATLLFRGLSSWLPRLPGYWFSRARWRPT